MKQILKLIVAILFMAVAVNSYAAKNEDITMIVTSDGATKDEAIKNALRNAIEQTYGVFVSANTDILNEEVIRDEIATVASGNIKKYTELSSVKNEDDTNSVTVEAIVSVGKLINYAKSKGAECEFDGQAMYADLEMQSLYQKNEERAIENLLKEVSEMFKNGFEYSLKISRPSHMEQEMYQSHNRKNPFEKDQYKNETDQIFIADIEIKLNQQGEDAWLKLMDALKILGDYKGVDGRYYSGGKITNLAKAMFGKGGIETMEGNDVFPYHTIIPEPKVGNIGPNMYLDSYVSHFYFRSQSSTMMIDDFIKGFQASVNNFSIDTNNGDNIDFIDLGFRNSNRSDSRLAMQNGANYFNKKKGKTLAQLRGVFSLPAGQIKQLSKLTIRRN